MMRIEEILNILGPAPAAQPVTLDEQTFTEITKVYHEMYAGALSAFFETNWYYFSENGKMSFPRHPDLVDHMASFLRLLNSVKTDDLAQMAYSGALETRIVWELARTAAAVDKPSPAVRIGLPPDGDPAEARSRFQIVEALLCGDLLSSNPLCPPFQDHDTHRSRQFDFWYHLGEFIRKRDDSDSHATHNAKEEVLNRLRHLLDGRENRDILYSIAVARELAPQFDTNYAHAIPQHLDETDPKNRLAVASKFIVDESQVTGGTTNVVRRISDIAARAFVNPGINVVRAT
jgi:white-opaque regulator 2